MDIVKGMRKRPRKCMLFGTHKIGKTTWAAQAGNVYLVDVEGGADDVGCARSKLCRSLGSVNAVLSDLATQPHDFQWVAIDTLDWTERLIFAAIAETAGKKSIDEIGYKKGYDLAVTHWDFLLRSLEHLMAARNMGVILLAHARIVKIEEPDKDAYTKFEPDLDKRSCAMIQEWCDEVFFARYLVNVVSKGEGFDKRGIAVGSNERVMYTTEAPGYYAGRRIPMPDVLPLYFSHYLAAIKAAYNGQTAPAASTSAAPSAPQVQSAGDGNNIAGIVTNGHSQPQTEPAPEWATA